VATTRAEGEVLTAGSSDVHGAGSVARPARAYPGATRGGADSRSPRHACLPWEGALPRGDAASGSATALGAWAGGPDAKAGTTRAGARDITARLVRG
jgi:hypothetical protein